MMKPATPRCSVSWNAWSKPALSAFVDRLPVPAHPLRPGGGHEREHELLARGVQLAGGAVQPAEREPLHLAVDRRPPVERGLRRARVGELRLAEVDRPERELDDQQRDRQRRATTSDDASRAVLRRSRSAGIEREQREQRRERERRAEAARQRRLERVDERVARVRGRRRSCCAPRRRTACARSGTSPFCARLRARRAASSAIGTFFWQRHVRVEDRLRPAEQRPLAGAVERAGQERRDERQGEHETRVPRARP